MPEYLAPGVYIEERPGQRTIEGVATSTAAFVGITRRGPIEGPPVLVTSLGDFQAQFGGYVPIVPEAALENGEHGHLPLALKQFFDNGGKRAFISRVFKRRPKTGTGPDPDLRSLQLGTGVIARLRANAPPQADHVFLTTSRGFTAGTSELVRDSGAGAPKVKLNELQVATLQAKLATPVSEQQRSDTAFAVLVPLGTTDSAKLVAREPGVWAEGVRVQVRPYGAPPVRTSAALPANTTTIPVVSNAGFYVGGTIQLVNTTGGLVSDVHYATISAIAGNVLTIDTTTLPGYPLGETWVSVAEVDVIVSWGTRVERHRGSWRYVDRATPPTGWSAADADAFNAKYSVWLRLHQRSTLVRLDSEDAVPAASIFPTPYNAATPLTSHPTTEDGSAAALGPEGTLARDTPDEVPGFPEYVGNAGAGPGARSGLAALTDEESISLVSVPGISDPLIQAAVISHCEQEKYRFAVLDSPPNASLAAARAHRGRFDSKYAAVYYPWVQLAHPLTGALMYVPPSGTMLGIYARSDAERGVHKAPANEVTRNAIDLETRVSTGDQEVLNPEGINVIRDFRPHNRGIRVWGARTISSDPEWVYVNVRRLFIFIEASIDRGTQWVVFEPNNPDLWGRVRRTIETFLDAQWRIGALLGAKATDAYYVKCDRSTMTLDDIANGRLVVEIGIAPTRPAEFVIFRIGQFTADTRAN